MGVEKNACNTFYQLNMITSVIKSDAYCKQNIHVSQLIKDNVITVC